LRVLSKMVAKYDHGGRFARFYRDGRDIDDVVLPGDEDDILKLHIKRAIARDEWYNRDELEVYMCMRMKRHYSTPWCFTEGCTWCGNTWG
jgi:hypothetical protein